MVHICEGVIVRLDQLCKLVEEVRILVDNVKRGNVKNEEYRNGSVIVSERAYHMFYESVAASYLVIGNPYGQNNPLPYSRIRFVSCL